MRCGYTSLFSMPNKRDPRKKKVGVWLLPEEEAALLKCVKKTGHANVADFMRSLLHESPPNPIIKPQNN